MTNTNIISIIINTGHAQNDDDLWLRDLLQRDAIVNIGITVDIIVGKFMFILRSYALNNGIISSN